MGCIQNHDPEIFTGWWSFEWRLMGGEETPPFYYIELTEDGAANYYGEYGDLQDIGSLSHNSEDGWVFSTSSTGEQYIYNWGTNDSDINFIEIGSQYRFLYSSEQPEIIGSGAEPYDPLEGIDGTWVLNSEENIEGFPTQIEISGYDVICYDDDGTIIIEDYLDYNEQRGLNGNPPLIFNAYAVDFGEYEGEKYLDLMLHDLWYEGGEWVNYRYHL